MTLIEYLLYEIVGYLWSLSEKNSLGGLSSKEEYYADLNKRIEKNVKEKGGYKCQKERKYK